MTYNNFKNGVLLELKQVFNSTATVEIKTFTKNNGKKLDGIIISSKDTNVSPTIYLNPLYHKYLEGLPIKQIVTEISNIYYNNPSYKDFDTNQFLDFDDAKNHIFFKLINYEKNKELLEDIPHMKFLDLAVVFGYFVETNSSEFASILIHNSHTRYWEVTTDDLYKIALINTPKLFSHKFSNLLDTIKTLSANTSLNDIDYSNNKLPENFNTDFSVLTNKYSINGASCILYRNLLKNYANEKQSNLIIIPSSIHEGATRFVK
ncbi:DUF5688 family protein [Lachnobacterium bovis]|uniref:Uncharacterized protein n=1 Tax=Lachnobacterium bovis TaxID=140626 RepID=A0A1H9PWA8_9FIRM|nr:DUF5688 family protein [Lachnobacterium bovis]SER51873.1 hypothetical protein SAMN02910429_00314 [Lachnobacterium bovis]